MDWIDQERKRRELQYEPKYGPIRPKTDPRCFRREMIEELLDAINYAQWSKVKGEINLRQWKRMDAGIRRVIHEIETACSDRFSWETSWL